MNNSSPENYTEHMGRKAYRRAPGEDDKERVADQVDHRKRHLIVWFSITTTMSAGGETVKGNGCKNEIRQDRALDSTAH